MIDQPRLLLLLLAALPFGWIVWRRYRTALPGVLSVASGDAREVANLFLIRWFFTNLSFVLAMIFLVLALSGVHWGRAAQRERPRGVDVVLAFDVSRSMLARDVRPSRLERAVAVSRSLVDRHPGTPFGIVVFRGKGSVLLPVTDDVSAIRSSLDYVDAQAVTAPGTNLEDGLLVAAEAFPVGRETRKVVVVFTDGGFLEGNPRRGATSLAGRGIELVIVGAGGTEAVPIPLDGGYLTDSAGMTVLTALRAEVLETMAEVSRGVSARIDDGDLIERIGKSVEGSVAREGEAPDRYRLMLTIGLILLSVWLVLRTVRWRGLF